VWLVYAGFRDIDSRLTFLVVARAVRHAVPCVVSDCTARPIPARALGGAAKSRLGSDTARLPERMRREERSN
jgi:hypothetical protein